MTLGSMLNTLWVVPQIRNEQFIVQYLPIYTSTLHRYTITQHKLIHIDNTRRTDGQQKDCWVTRESENARDGKVRKI